jgi:hypothetical protein
MVIIACALSRPSQLRLRRCSQASAKRWARRLARRPILHPRSRIASAAEQTTQRQSQARRLVILARGFIFRRSPFDKPGVGAVKG